MLFPQSSFAEKIILAADPWCPYNCEPKSEKEGMMIDIARKIFAKKNIEIEYVSMPWARAVKEARRGTIAGIIGALKTDAPDFIFPEFPQGIITDAFYTNTKSSWKFSEINSLKEGSLGIIEGYSYGKQIDDYVRENRSDYDLIQTIAGDNALETNINRLISGELSIVIDDMNVFNYNLNKMGLKDEVRFAGVVIENDSKSNYLYIAFSPDNENSKKYADILTKGMKKIISNGEIKNILRKYNFVDWTKSVKK